MGLEISRETTIDAPRERVWAYLSDFGKHVEWAEPKHALRIEAPREVRAGATFSSVGKDMGRDSKNAVTITEVVPGERIVYVATQEDGTVWRNTLALSDAGRGTRVVKSDVLLSARFPMNVITAILAPLAKSEGAKVFDGDLARIKARVEGAAVVAS